MNSSQNSFFPKYTYYDFFGYFFSGMYVLISIYIFHYFSQGHYHFSEIFSNIFSNIFLDLKNINLWGFLLLSFAAYLIGHFVSLFSTLVIELYMEKWENIENHLPYGTTELILEQIDFIYEIRKSKALFQKGNFNKIRRFLIAYVDEKYSNIYSTAFVFLSFNEMALSMAISSFVFFMIFTMKNWHCNFFAEVYFILTMIFIGIFLKFYVLFWQEIISGFLLKEID